MRRADGFTLVEAMVAMAILSIVMLGFLGMRTTALVHATEARYTRLAREVADRLMSELKAGAREVPPDSGLQMILDNLPDFTYRFLIGESAIAEYEGQRSAAIAASEADQYKRDRLEWQRERDDLRTARNQGTTLMELRENRALGETLEEKIPSETELEDVMLVIEYPDARGRAESTGTGYLALKVRARISTMALQGLTPDEAESIAKARGAESSTANTPTAAGSAPVEGR